jgi:hypothetical protein
MSEKIWGGVDYLPLIWDRWLADPDGALLTATLDGRPVGMSKITLLAPGEVWLEGLRLHPELQGRGLSSNINRATLREAMKLNPKTVRFSTAVINTASRHLAERTGFWQIARTRWMWGRARTRGVLGGRVATPDDLANVWGFAKGSECYERTGGLLCVGWKFPALTRHRLKDLIERGSLLLYPARGKLRTVAMYDVSSIDRDVCLAFADGRDEEIGILARDILRIAGRLGKKDASAMIPAGRLAEAVYEGGFDSMHPFTAVVYELGARGARAGGEPLDSALWRTLRANEGEAAELLTDLLLDRAPGNQARENVRDFVVRNVVPETEREIAGAIQALTDPLGSAYELRDTLRALIEYLARDKGLAGPSMKVTDGRAAFHLKGRRVALMAVGRKTVRLTLGPGFGGCFPKGLALRVDRTSFDETSFDPATGKYGGMTLWLSKGSHLAPARRAVDMIVRSAERAPA